MPAYDRWLMTAASADTLTGVAVTDDALAAAEAEIVEAIGWRPKLSTYSQDLDVDGDPVDERVSMLGRAIAWQAAHRTTVAATATDGVATGTTSETIGRYSRSIEAGTVTAPLLAPRAFRLLTRGGWLNLTGQTRP